MAAPAPQATPASSSYTPVLTDLLRLVRVPFAPGGVFGEQQEKPTFWMPWIVLSVIFGVVSFFALPITLAVAHIAAEARGTPLPPSAVTITEVATVVGPAVGLLIACAIGAVILYFILMVQGATARFKGLMCIQIFAATVTVLQTAITTVMLRMRGVESIQSQADAQQSLGLDLMLSPEFAQAHRAIAGLMRGIGPFEIWALVLCAIGLMSLEKVPKNKAWTTAVIAFVIGLLIRAGSALIFKAG